MSDQQQEIVSEQRRRWRSDPGWGAKTNGQREFTVVNVTGQTTLSTVFISYEDGATDVWSVHALMENSDVIE